MKKIDKKYLMYVEKLLFDQTIYKETVKYLPGQTLFCFFSGHVGVKKSKTKIKFVLAIIFTVPNSWIKLITSQRTSDIFYQNFAYPVVLATVKNNTGVSNNVFENC